MVKYKNIRIPKRGGGSRLQRVQVLASGKYKFVKNIKSGKRSGSKPKTKSKKKSKRKSLSKKVRSRVGRGFSWGSIFKMVRIAAFVMPQVEVLMRNEPMSSKIPHMLSRLTGFKDGQFSMDELKRGWGPFVMASLATYGIPKMNSMIRKLF